MFISYACSYLGNENQSCYVLITFQKLLWAHHRPFKRTIDFLEMPTLMWGFLCLLLRLDVKMQSTLTRLFSLRIDPKGITVLWLHH